ncbi:uncharacterized protein LOC130794012 [Actinidia eriantha]|uniref:uncharacterized protein LOC130794012 n=1 Tax=Actinidia eriantha TaxID=165200 RepID=UPI002589DB3A|nr:uncharacterized protein LOC130794012 [Actinidia eriantha]XP_057511884.1 uncharacterized protein LOC130794012 [Actinidia eriantha]
MDGQVDHYIILGLPSGAEGAQISEKEITKAYRKKALELHPDKRPDDRNAHSDILQLNASYEILKDEKARKLFDDLLRIRREKVHRRSQHDSKRQRMMSDLEKREQAAFAPDPAAKAQEEEQIISMKLKEEIARIRAMQANKVASATPTQRKEATVGGWESSMDGGGSGLDKEKVLKVSWEKIGDDYSAQRLRELFEKFGKVEDVVIKSSKKTLKRGSALVVMASKDAAVAATGTVCGDLTNPLLVLPLQPAVATAFTRPHEHVEPDGPKLNNLVGAGYQSFEASVLKKMMQKAAEKQK